MRRVLIVCTGNSCRSLMAEAMINYYLGDTWEAFSAGITPASPNHYALKVLRELGISTEGLRSKSTDEFLHRGDIDYVVTVCDQAHETCPYFPGNAERFHMSFPDPAPYSLQPEEVALPVFRALRDDIRQRLIPFLAELHG